MENQDVSIVIPAYNEEKSIGEITRGLRAHNDKWEIIVVDDGSHDKTAAIAEKELARVLRHPYNMGYGAALKTGIHAAKHDTVVLLDADGQHRDLKDIDRLLEHIDKYDMVVGARSSASHQPLLRRPGKWLLAQAANYLVWKKIPDLNSGFRAFHKDLALNFMHLLPDTFSFTTTITLIAFSEGFQIKYIPITTYKRLGNSTVSFVKDGLGTLLLLLRIIMLFNPLRVFIPISIILFVMGVLRLFTGVFAGVDYTITSVLGILSSVLIFFIGLLADQIASMRKDNYYHVKQLSRTTKRPDST